MENRKNDIALFVGALKETILQNQYNAAKLVKPKLVRHWLPKWSFKLVQHCRTN